MVDSEDESSVREELSHRQETLLFLSDDENDHLLQPCTVRFDNTSPEEEDYPLGYDPEYVPDPAASTDYPGYYKEAEKKYGLRKATTYKGKPHPSHVRIDKRSALICI